MMFLYGYKGKQVTRQQIEQSALVTCLEPEFARRLLGAMQECADDGHQIGIGSTIRSTATQRAGFLRSHDIYTGGPIPKTCRGCVLDGVRYILKPRTAHKALPGGSCHERLTAPFHTVVTAADMVGERDLFAKVYAPRWGLRDFGKVNGEVWHIQPADLPGSRSRFRTSMFPLKRWPREEDDMAAVAYIVNQDGTKADLNPWTVTGFTLARITEPVAQSWRYLGVRQLPNIGRQSLALYPRPAGDLGPFSPDEFCKTTP